MKKWSILFLLFFNFVFPKTAIIFINPVKNLNEKTCEARSVFHHKIKDKAERDGDLFYGFQYQLFDGNEGFEFKYNAAELFTLLLLIKDKYEKINVFCFGCGENIFNFVSHKIDQKNLINRIYVFDKCGKEQPAFNVIKKIYNFYSKDPKIQGLTGDIIYESVVGVDRNKIININVDIVSGKNKEAIFYYKYLGAKLLNLQDWFDEVQDITYKDKHLFLPTNKKEEIIVNSCQVS